jgi:YidC/Oxa1 family membrane protein insertase
MLNGLIALCSVLFSNFGLAIVTLTITVRLLMLPLTMKQLHASKKMAELGPRLQELQKKHAKDQEMLGREQMKLYKESGVSPAGCVLPMLIQLPIWIALYQSIIRALATTPEQLLNLSTHLYSWSVVHQMIPLTEDFLWLNLGQPDSYYILPILVGGTMWLQQKMATQPSIDPKQQSMSNMMLWMMPLMFAFFTLQFPSGLSLYWVISNVISIAMQYFVTGWGALSSSAPVKRPARTGSTLAGGADISYDEDKSEGFGQSFERQKGTDSGKPRDKRQDGKGSHQTSIRATKRKPRRGRSHRH